VSNLSPPTSIFLGSLKPYLLDSYLGVFGKQVVDGTAMDGGLQDALLLIALGVSVLIGVFASQLANETWDSINEEIEIDKAEKAALEDNDEDGKDGIIREFMGMGIPQPIIGFQLALQSADSRVNNMIEEEYKAKVWNCTDEELKLSLNNPAIKPSSPEVVQANSGFDFGASICAGLVLSPALLGAYLKYADPLFVEEDKSIQVLSMDEPITAKKSDTSSNDTIPTPQPEIKQQQLTNEVIEGDLLKALSALRERLQSDIDKLG
jgi:hypothetical protein